MSQEIVILATVPVAPGKLDRFKEVVSEAIVWIKANEPETLEFSCYEEHSEDGVKLLLYEKYASQAAVDKHEGSDNYKKFFKAVTEEELLRGPPMISRGKYHDGFHR